MRADNEREIVQLLAELHAAQTTTPPTPTPGDDPSGPHRHIVEQWSAPEARDRRAAPPGPELSP
jgi:hypothetical protein